MKNKNKNKKKKQKAIKAQQNYMRGKQLFSSMIFFSQKQKNLKTFYIAEKISCKLNSSLRSFK